MGKLSKEKPVKEISLTLGDQKTEEVCIHSFTAGMDTCASRSASNSRARPLSAKFGRLSHAAPPLWPIKGRWIGRIQWNNCRDIQDAPELLKQTK